MLNAAPRRCVPCEEVGLDANGTNIFTVISEIGTTLGVDSWFPVVPHAWTPLSESGVCSLKHVFSPLTGYVEIVLWGFCAYCLVLAHVCLVWASVGFLGLLVKLLEI